MPLLTILNTKRLYFQDMAPRYMVSRQMGDSEYSATYIPQAKVRTMYTNLNVKIK